MHRAASVSLILFFSAVGAFATVRTVTPTGSDPADRNNIQAAVNAAAPGDTIQLAAGTFVLSGGGGDVYVGKPSLTIAGTAGTRLVGPGSYNDYDDAEYDGFFVGAAGGGTRFEQLTFEKLEYAIIVGRDVNGLSVRDCNFVADGMAIWAAGNSATLPSSHYYGMTLVHNTVTTPQRAEVGPDYFTGGFYLRGVHDLVATDNVFHGPGMDPTLAGTPFVTSVGLWIADKERNAQRPTAPDPSSRGLIARNTVDNFDFGIVSTASGAVILENTVTACSTGIGVGTAYGNLLMTGVRIISNNTTGNYDGIVVWGTQQSLLLHNDARDNSDAGIVFMDGLIDPPIPSINNESTHNTGSVRNNPGNRNGKPRNQTGVL